MNKRSLKCIVYEQVLIFY